MIIRTFLRRAASHYATALLAGLLFCGLLLGGVIHAVNSKIENEKGLFPSGATYSGENFHNNLDLNIAAKATYPSSPLKVVKSLGAPIGLPEKEVSFKVTDDNLTEYGLMTLPAGKAPANGWPAIILCHGYSNPAKYSELSTYVDDMLFYSRHGFAVIKPDYRGQGLSRHAGQATSGYFSMAYNTDVMSLISALKQTSYIDKANLNLWGHSFGSYIALRAAVLSPDIKNLILLSGPVDSLSKMYLTYQASSDDNNLYALKTRQAVFKKYGPPTQNTLFWKDASPIYFVGRITARIQIHVGELDRIVPPLFSADLDAALTKGGIAHQYFKYRYGEHGLLDQRSQIWQRSLQLLQMQPGLNLGG